MRNQRHVISILIFCLLSISSFCQVKKSGSSKRGVAFHDVILKDTNGNEVDTKLFRGKYTLVVFWASWCGPCRRENPDLNKLYSVYKNRGFEMIGVSIDADAEEWKEAIHNDRLSWIQLLDPAATRSELLKFYGIGGIPSTILLDDQGKIVNTDKSIREIERFLKKLSDIGSSRF